jgi:hypothetical protein
MTRLLKIVLTASIAANVVTSLVVIRGHEHEVVRKAYQFDLYCSTVRDAMFADAHDFADPKFRDQARQRFLQGFTFHSALEIGMCATEPLDLMRCRDSHDEDCRLNLARDAAASIPSIDSND